ncbi:hypothetical protein ACFOY8_14695 [Thalassospira xianhensis]|uniref:Uncharacterized protein n=1 Tax=Thalassospira xianhensis MCCC 1A02616 TaxID=1177929 RepID=A0A367UKF8_9PROT|nr:hypothetical protein TH5_00540 [Thalassospira xianhensis MCCC 1A02616]
MRSVDKQSTEVEIEKAIPGLLKDLVHAFEQDALLSLQAFEGTEPFVRAEELLNQGYVSDAHTMLSGQINKVVRGFYTKHLGSGELVFLMQNLDFFRSQLREIFNKKEGSACCADKAGYIIRCMFKALHTGEQIVHPVNEQDGSRPYYVPAKVFREHEEIMGFFEAVHSLFYGRPDKFAALCQHYSNIPNQSY